MVEGVGREKAEVRIRWYRTPIDKEQLRALTQRSDWKGALQTVGFLGLLAVTGTTAYLAVGHMPWPVAAVAILIHGSFFGFLLNGFHELCHQTVFRTRGLNLFFAHVFSLLSWNNVYWFTSSHTRHHQYTLHPPQDLEVVLPIRFTLKEFLLNGLISPRGFWRWLLRTIRISAGRLEGEWEHRVYPESDVAGRRRFFWWSRAILAFHLAILAVSIRYRLWMLPVLTTLAPFYGGWLLYLLNNTQHVGLKDDTPDFRLCCRTILVNPFLCFLYWNMNYHIEHHMYAAVPCYHLRRLHKAIRHELPPSPRGLVETWVQITGILKRQKMEPGYQYEAPLPGPVRSGLAAR